MEEDKAKKERETEVGERGKRTEKKGGRLEVARRGSEKGGEGEGLLPEG